MKIPFNNRPMFWQGGGSFVPRGDLAPRALLTENPVRWDSKVTWAARVIVGFKRKGKRPITLAQLVRLVREIHIEQVGDPGSSFLRQRGLYRHDSGSIVDEPGAQVVIFNVSGVSPKTFEKQIEQLAEDVATEFDQESVIVEIQRNGVTQRTFGMGRR